MSQNNDEYDDDIDNTKFFYAFTHIEKDWNDFLL